MDDAPTAVDAASVSDAKPGNDASITRTINVILTQPYTDTGLSLQSGQGFTIRASGMMNFFTGGCPSGHNCIVDPNGIPVPAGGCGAANVAPNLNCVSLIGKIGIGGVPFEVGTMLDSNPGSGVSGELFLGVNDSYFVDNTGQWTAVVTIFP